MTVTPGWTDERVTAFKTHAAAGLSASQIGDEMGISRNAVIGKARRAGIHLTNYEEKRQLGRLPPARKRRRYTEPRDVGLRFACAIMDLDGETCRWPMGEPAHDMLYCGAESKGPWCPLHRAIVYKPAWRRV